MVELGALISLHFINTLSLLVSNQHVPHEASCSAGPLLLIHPQKADFSLLRLLIN